MSRSHRQRLEDILAACLAIGRHLGEDADESLVFDAIRIRLVEIGEAVKDLDDAVRAAEPGIPWAEIARTRDHLTHRYFDATHAIVMVTARRDIPALEAAVERMLAD